MIDSKDINTRFGHLTGDVAIAEIAAILKREVRGSDSVVRYGGDEFLIILGDTDVEGSRVVVTRIAKSVEDSNSEGNLSGFDLTLSIGLAEWSEEKTLDQVLNEVDQNMYSSKEARRSAT